MSFVVIVAVAFARTNALHRVVHMVLFMVMVLFLTQAVAMARMGEATQRTWSAWESRRCGRLSRRTCALAQRFLDASYTELLLQPYCPKRLRALLYAATRQQFVSSYQLEDAQFDFANYLAIALGRTFAEIVEVPVKTWLWLEVCMILFFCLESVPSGCLRSALWVGLGYCILAMAFVVHAKLRLVLRSHVSTWVEAAVAANKSRKNLREVLLPSVPIQVSATLRTSSARKLPNYAIEPQKKGRRTKDDSALSNISNAAIELAERSHATDYSRGTELTQIIHIDEVDELSPESKVSKAAPWLSVEHARQSSCEDVDDRDSLLSSANDSEWQDRVFGFTVGALQRCGVLAMYLFEAFERVYAKIMECVAAFQGVVLGPHAQNNRRTLRGSSMSSQELERYATMFWFGRTHKAHFTLDVIRTIPLFMSIYIAVFALVYARLYLKSSVNLVQHMQNVVFVTISIIPPIALQIKLPFVVEDYTVAANVGAFLNLRYIEQVLSHQKTVAAFQALRVAACLQHLELLVKVITEQKQRQTATNADVKCFVNADRHRSDDLMHVEDHEMEDQLVEKLEVAEALERRRRRSWANIFLIFDVDRKGSIDRLDLPPVWYFVESSGLLLLNSMY